MAEGRPAEPAGRAWLRLVKEAEAGLPWLLFGWLCAEIALR